ncbi:hypothetical protein Tco_1051124 [Tanacetum coccineum]
MHNDIMAAGSKEYPPMLTPDSYAQWQSRFLRYADLKPNRKLLRQCIFEDPYVLTEITTPAVPANGDNPARDGIVREETYNNTTPNKRALIDVEAEAESEAVHMILNRIGMTYTLLKFTSETGNQLSHTTQGSTE